MKKYILAIIISLLMFGCSSSSDDFKFYQNIKVAKDGSVSVSGELTDHDNLPVTYHKVYFNKKGKVTKEYYQESGKTKRSSSYEYENGKIMTVKHFDGGKYNGISEYVYGMDGLIEKEMMYDREMNFLFAKKL
ncbi:hypothetical protein ACFL2A_02105 [Thermodesulfobacteriota bacterium]